MGTAIGAHRICQIAQRSRFIANQTHLCKMVDAIKRESYNWEMSSMAGPSLPADPSSEVATRTGKSIATAVEIEPGAPTDVDLMLRIQAEDNSARIEGVEG
jgi:hypothetical protein